MYSRNYGTYNAVIMYIAYCRKNTERLQTGKLLRFYRSTESELYTVRLTRDSRIWDDSFSSILCWRQSWLGSIMTVPLVFVSNRRSRTAAAGRCLNAGGV